MATSLSERRLIEKWPTVEKNEGFDKKDLAGTDDTCGRNGLFDFV